MGERKQNGPMPKLVREESVSEAKSSAELSVGSKQRRTEKGRQSESELDPRSPCKT